MLALFSKEKKDFILKLSGYTKYSHTIWLEYENIPEIVYEKFVKEFNAINKNFCPYVEVSLIKKFPEQRYNYLEFYFWDNQIQGYYNTNTVFDALEKFAKHIGVNYIPLECPKHTSFETIDWLKKRLCINILRSIESNLRNI